MISLHKFLNKSIIKSCKVTCSRRWFHGEQLKNRSLVQVSGHESKDFLQGLITNDMEHLTDHASSMFTMFLNVQGRVLFDSIIFKTDDKESFIIDCDSEVIQPLINHMKLYKVRRKINFEQLKCYSLWVVFDKDIDVKELESTNIDALYLNPQSKFQSSYKEKLNLPNGTIVAPDPRLQYLGDRIILPSESTLDETNPSLTLVSGSFDKFRLKLGVGEGIHEIIRGKSLPLEINCDYLHGVSFQKGCYIGQELTARTYHTGVIRKRIMPLTFDSDVSNQQNSSITNEKGKNVGKVIRTSGEYGIGLLRINEVLKAKNLNIGKINVKTFRPGWWPIEASKDRQSLTSND